MKTCIKMKCLLLFTSMAFFVSSCQTKTDDERFSNSIEMVMIKLPFGYYVSAFETRQSEFEAVMGYNPSKYPHPEHPVECVTGSEAVEFCRKLTELERNKGTLPQGFVYTLPTYKQWRQYVADAPLAGSITPRGQNGAELKSPMPVGSGEQNRFGLYDLRGNVAEYSIEPYSESSSLTMFGASWLEHRKDYYSVRNRSGYEQDGKSINVGFRCVLVPEN